MKTDICVVCDKTFQPKTEITYESFCDECIPKIKKHPIDAHRYIIALTPTRLRLEYLNMNMKDYCHLCWNKINEKSNNLPLKKLNEWRCPRCNARKPQWQQNQEDLIWDMIGK